MVHKYAEDDVLKKCPWCGVDAKLVTVHEKRISHYVCATCAKTVRISTRNKKEDEALAELNATPGDAEAEAEAREGTGL